jgi:hypothetical protein
MKKQADSEIATSTKKSLATRVWILLPLVVAALVTTAVIRGEPRAYLIPAVVFDLLMVLAALELYWPNKGE